MLFALLLMLTCSSGLSAYNVSGVVTDSNGDPLSQAALRLLTVKDSALVKGVLADVQGRFRIADVKKGSYILETSYIGMQTQYRNIAVTNTNLQVDTIRLADGSISLDDVVVRGVRNQIKVMEDTVEYTADAYKTQPNAVVEDLLKRLPGVEVGNDGSITANGKSVSKILVDGEEFFSSDPKVASKNLPVNMVDKLQVVDRKSDLARMTGIDDGEEETVINLTVKQGMKNGYFGAAYAGYGTDERYKGGFNINRFKDGNMFTLLGNLNNINEEGFTDENGNRFQRFGGSNGINSTQSLGLNFNVGNQKIFRVGGDIMYSHNSRNNETSRERQYLFTDSTSYINSQSINHDAGHNINGNFRIQWNPDSFNTLEVRPNISYNVNDSWSNDTSMTIDGKLRPVNNSLKQKSSDGHSFQVGARVIYNHKFRSRPGRSLSLMFNASHSKTTEDVNSYSRNYFWRRLPQLLNDSIDLYDQLLDRMNLGDNVSARVSWNEPLGDPKKGNYLYLSYNISYRRNSSDKMVYDHPVSWPDGISGDPLIDYLTTVWNDSLSNQFRNDYLNQDIRVGYKKVSKTANLDVGISLVPQRSESKDLVNSARNIAPRNVLNYSPFLRYRHKFTKRKSLSINYQGRSAQPTLTQLQPVADMSDPLHITVGNPDLDPSFTHNLNLRFQNFKEDSKQSLMVMAGANMVQNSIVSKTTFDPVTGGQTTTYANVNGVWSANLRTMFNQPLRNQNWSINNGLFGNYNQNVGFNNGLRNRSGSFNINEMLGVSFRPDNLELTLNARYGFRHTMNSVKTVTTKDVHSYGGTFMGTWYTPIGLVVSTDLSYTGSQGQAAGYDRDDWMWNATISYQMLRDKSLVIGITGKDLLGQQRNTSYNVTANYIENSRFNTLTRYFMATVTYKFNTIGKGKTPRATGDDDEERGPGGRRGGFSGPPPGGGMPGGRPNM